MPPEETRLAGGNASAFVTRSGDTVRKPWTVSSATVQRFLAHVRGEVGDIVPAPLGRDDDGRQVLEFVPGVEAMAQLPLTVAEAEHVGSIIRRLHDAASGFDRLPDDIWTSAMRRAGDEVVGHSDLAPWNLIRDGSRWAFIDWDGAGPTTRIADLAYAARSFAQFDAEHDLETSIALIRAIADGYEATAALRARLAPAMAERAEAMRDLLADGARSGAQPWATLAATGHLRFWSDAAVHAHRHEQAISAALA